MINSTSAGVRREQRQILRRCAVNLSVCFSVLIGTSANAEWSGSNPALNELLQQASQVSGLPVVRGMGFDVKAVPKSELLRLTCRGKKQCDSGTVAAYLINERRIVYDMVLDLNTNFHKSFIVHEFVHALQHIQQGDDVNASCQAIVKNETAAYRAQARWLSIRGITVNIDKVFRMRCAD